MNEINEDWLSLFCAFLKNHDKSTKAKYTYDYHGVNDCYMIICC